MAAREARAEGGALATELLQMKPPPLHGWMGRRAATATWLGLGSGLGLRVRVRVRVRGKGYGCGYG